MEPLVSTEGLVEAGVVDLVWGYGWRAPTIESLRAAQHGIDQSPSTIALPKRAVIYTFNMALPRLLSQLASEGGDGHYVVISRDGDPSFRSALPPCVHHVFAINATARAGVTPMPTGAYFSADQRYVRKAAELPRKQTGRVLVAYSLDMPGSVYGPTHERITAIEHFRDKPWATVAPELLGWATRPSHIVPTWSWPEYLAKVREHEFLAVPCGYGVDRAAGWEAMALGTIPISPRHPELLHFSDMPIAFVDNWQEVTPDWLDAHRGLIERSTEKIRLSYWVDRVREKRAELGLPSITGGA